MRIVNCLFIIINKKIRFFYLFKQILIRNTTQLKNFNKNYKLKL